MRTAAATSEPLIVQAGTGRVIAGNGWLIPMKKCGWIDCDVVEHALAHVIQWLRRRDRAWLWAGLLPVATLWHATVFMTWARGGF